MATPREIATHRLGTAALRGCFLEALDENNYRYYIVKRLDLHIYHMNYFRFRLFRESSDE